ncbi:glutamine synthetase family protein [Candidatus Lokiarchaeum ossiferum]|uniref:glutamine synthetase family protein n=1 Tax=Candidatus Lokiarchaeum ossiferum TaxID=2951803 RepID=UPI00352ED071
MTEFTVEYFKEKGIDYIQYQFTTLMGDLKEVEFPAQNWENMKEGTGVDGSSLGFLSTEQSDMRAIPDLETFAILPWSPRVGRFICNMVGNDGLPYPTCPRGILIKVLAEADSMGYVFKTRPELEWYFLDDDLDPADEGDYMCTVPKDHLHEVRRQITDDMLSMFSKGSPHTVHHEVGPAQHEIELSKLDGLAQADNVQTGKLIVKSEALFNGLVSTFMPKPFAGKAGSGLHIHEYLEDKEGNNIFATEGGISDELKYFIGGTIKHADAISALLNPSTNSYKRLVPNHEAPVHKAWGIGNRTALMRVPGYESKAHMEFRAGDGTMNIYLGCAALLAAGLDGIRNKIQPNIPTRKNVDHLTDEERASLGISQLPSSLKDSLDAFEESEFITKVFGQQFKDIYLEKKRAELIEHLVAVNNHYEQEWEIDRYLHC